MAGAPEASAPARPVRILVTGFSVFPGAPVNPTEALARILHDEPPTGEGIEAFRADVLAVEYATIQDRLSAIGREFLPDIVIHFGLARECSGFRLERVARNSHAEARPDQSGHMPDAALICAGPDILPSTLPLDRIAERLALAGLPVEWSDDAGGYLCNTVMTLSLAYACDGLRPVMSGFVHVPPLKEAEPENPHAMGIDDLVAGARLIIDASVAAWAEKPNPRDRQRSLLPRHRS
ncbi:pyroglutamyl-peptidase I [Aquamicrobium sp. LC103]|uniref:pyroglutamyl-peptidase I n=1 Tax=Aquamicrobium sp. LC103 TaxID=1120658 RepID=UPI00069B3ACB|nr:pyroglutamyl-peptidase I [Aquamicrobium sp. LC103]